VTGGVATVPTYSDNETLINRLIDTWGDAADTDNKTIQAPRLGGTGQDSSAWDGCYPSLDAGIWSCDDNDTRMQRLIGLVIGVDVLATNGDGSGLSGVVTAESDPAAGAVTGIVSSNGAGVFSAATYADVVGLWSTCSGYLKDDGTCDTPAGGGDNETLVNRLVDADHADNNATDSETRSDASVTPASLAYWSQNALTTRLLAWLNGGTITGLNVGDGNFTVDAYGNVTAKSYATTKVSNTATQILLYGDNGTQTLGAGWKGPHDATARTASYFLRLPTAEPTSVRFSPQGLQATMFRR